MTDVGTNIVHDLNCETGELTVRPLSQPELDSIVAGQTAAAAIDQAAATFDRNRGTIADRATQAMATLRAAADALDAGTATAAQQRAALSLCCRTTARLVRLVLDELDTAE